MPEEACGGRGILFAGISKHRKEYCIRERNVFYISYCSVVSNSIHKIYLESVIDPLFKNTNSTDALQTDKLTLNPNIWSIRCSNILCYTVCISDYINKFCIVFCIAHNRYIEEILGITNPIDHNDSNTNPKVDTDTHTNTFATKKLYSLLKNKKWTQKALHLWWCACTKRQDGKQRADRKIF